MPVQQREHPQTFRTAGGFLGPDHIGEVGDDDLPLPSVGEPAAGENYAACAVAARREHRAGVRHVSETEAA
jgi:hypothetical protein